MAHRGLFTGVFVTLGVYLLLLILQQQMVYAAEASSVNSYSAAAAHKPRNRILTRFARPQNQYNKARPEMFNDFFVDDDDFFELPKRQASDDYGHMRFGKRGDETFDDYGHMRFGRSGSDK